MDGVGHFSKFTTGFYYTTPNLELKKVTCGRVTDKNCSVTGLKRAVEFPIGAVVPTRPGNVLVEDPDRHRHVTHRAARSAHAAHSANR